MAILGKNNQATQTAADQSMIDGFITHAATLVTLLVGGSTVKTSELVTVLQRRIAAIKTVIAAKATYLTAVAAMRAEFAESGPLVSGARQALKVAFAGHADLLGDFGLEPPKVRTPPTAEQKAEASARAVATRRANHPNAGKKSKGTTVPGGAAGTPKP
jgi:hypothetical protein